MKLHVQVIQGKFYPNPSQFHSISTFNFMQVTQGLDFKKMFFCKKCELSTWKMSNSQRQHMKYLSAPHLHTLLDVFPWQQSPPHLYQKAGILLRCLFQVTVSPRLLQSTQPRHVQAISLDSW